jgi:hypothetical protein
MCIERASSRGTRRREISRNLKKKVKDIFVNYYEKYNEYVLTRPFYSKKYIREISNYWHFKRHCLKNEGKSGRVLFLNHRQRNRDHKEFDYYWSCYYRYYLRQDYSAIQDFIDYAKGNFDGMKDDPWSDLPISYVPTPQVNPKPK